MAKYIYPAIFTPDDGGYAVNFPDIEGCFTCGASFAEAMEMAKDALCLMLYDLEEDCETIPSASNMKDVLHSDNEIVSMVCCDTVEYRKLYDNR